MQVMKHRVDKRARIALTGVAAAVAFAATVPAVASSSARPLQFRSPVALTPSAGFGGYEPGVLADRFGGVWVFAHKGNEGDVLSPDAQAADGVRGSSWVWWSSNGVHFADAPGGPVGAAPVPSELVFGDENAVDEDNAGHVYAVDTDLTDASITRWHVGRANQPPAFDFYRPVIPAGEAYDDRPWVAAHGNGVVMFMGNTWEQDAYPGNPASSSARGAAIVHMSYDGGMTFDPVGVPLDGSGWCRPAADHRPGSHVFYAICTTNSSAVRLAGLDLSSHMLYSYVSTDDGRTWHRYGIRPYTTGNPNASNWPSVAVAPNGTVYAAYVDQANGGAPSLWLFRSTNLGRTWQQQVIRWPDNTTSIPLFSVAVSPTGAVGLCLQDTSAVTAAVGSFGRTFAFTAVPTGGAPQTPYGDFTQCAFTHAGKLGVTWTALKGVDDADVYYSQQR